MPLLLDLNEDPIPNLNEVPYTVTCPAKGKRLTDLEKDQIVRILILNYNNDKLGRGMIKQIASKYEVTRLVISQIWKATLQAIKGDEHHNVHRKYKGGNKSKVFDLEKIIPAIKAKRPSDFNNHIFIQQDNVRPHISDNDEDFIKVAQDGEFYITLANQPPNSPDLNINDLGFLE
ncbi:hypothetical protein POM88_043681 [Heracleum sosnowskyi]|uniref:Uncharacterized protein n=1 Tax=Heracleum sosnowskyi TaxID=360622 RepID=A0AAD8M4I2_9APIA|nr:hypothetical protein POM88_043681 [Heracleum sosnowskyi]